ncbi:SDR family oxidoreductase [Rhodococcus sp. IEGM 1366]|uniref:SDR family NAD(P)-dependent oxidoreductase n=1 Tax=Rhodococcus sp. IEGM 1366 TaxID=3082223 RepID=UPI0029549F0C|nr:SDR family oxidoreductase [Rhodococcus sp. IEGM 1366]MDV8071473.1 SDR family oxidoreductase [Rhodococcus sp. IEGM 1366]
MTDFNGSVAVVTGAASGIGLETVRRLSMHGATVIAVDSNQSLLETEHSSSPVTAAPADVTDSASVDDLIRRITTEHGRLDILVNAAGIYRDGNIVDFDEKLAQDLFRVNVFGTLLPSQSAARAMIECENGGTIVNVSSIASQLATDTNGVYGATKGAVEALTRGFAVSLSPHRIRVNAVAPGPIDTPQAAAALHDPDYAERMLGRIALGTLGKPHDVAEAILFLAGGASTWVTGTVLTVDGGVRAQR